MKYKMKLTVNYTTNNAKDKDNAKDLALHHLYSELSQWADGRLTINELWKVEVEEVK